MYSIYLSIDYFSDSIFFLDPSLPHFASASWSHLSSSTSHSVHSAIQNNTPPTHTHIYSLTLTVPWGSVVRSSLQCSAHIVFFLYLFSFLSVCQSLHVRCLYFICVATHMKRETYQVCIVIFNLIDPSLWEVRWIILYNRYCTLLSCQVV